MNIKPAFISAISVVLSAIVAGVMFFEQGYPQTAPKEEAVFTSIEFDADDIELLSGRDSFNESIIQRTCCFEG